MTNSASPSSSSSQTSAQNLGLVILSFTLYWLAYECNELLDPYAGYMQGVSLIFLPAGIKLVMLMVTGWRGALGCGLAIFWMATTRFWAGLPLSTLASYAALSVGVTWIVVSLMLRHKALGPELEGLSFRDIVEIDVINTLLHGIAVNSLFWSLGQRSSEALWPSALAMALGDFLGNGIIMLLVLLVARFVVPQGRL